MSLICVVLIVCHDRYTAYRKASSYSQVPRFCTLCLHNSSAIILSYTSFQTISPFFITGYLLSLFLRLGAGEPLIQLPVFIKFPFYSSDMDLQLFPFRTFSMLCAILCTAVISYLSQLILTRLSPNYDILRCLHKNGVSAAIEAERSLTSAVITDDSYSKHDSLAFEEF